jgi:hypothetical protein
MSESNGRAWAHTHLRRVFFDMHLPDWTQPGQSGGAIADGNGVATAFDPQAIVDAFVRAHVNAAVIFAKCQYGNFYYNTRIGHKHTGLGDLDFLGDVTRLAHAHDIKIIGYYSNRWDVQLARQHPEWMARDRDGNLSYDRWPTLCLNSPYREVVHAHLDEMFALYDLDGVWSDIVHGQPCHCERCQQAYGKPIPRTETGPEWLDFLRWQTAYLDDYIASCRAVVKRARPEAAFIINFFGTPYTNPREGLSTRHLAHSDLGSTEGYTEWHGLLFPGYAARYMRMATGGHPFEVLTGRFIQTWDFSLRPTAQMRYEAFSVVANSGAVTLDDEPYHDGTLDVRVYDALADVYGEIAQREPYLLGAEPVAYAAIYHNQTARELDTILNRAVPPDPANLFPPSDLNPGPSDLLPLVMGAYKALTEAHIPVQFVEGTPASLATLDRYKAVYLPNVLSLTDEEADALRAYVMDGGGLVVTGGTSLYEADGSERDNFKLADLLGVDSLGRGAITFPYLQLHHHCISAGIHRAPLPHYTAIWRVQRQLDTVISVAATLRDALIETGGEVYYHNNQPPPGPDTGEPVITVRDVGKGRVVYCGALLASNYARSHNPAYRRLIANMLACAAGEGPFIFAGTGARNTQIIPNRLGSDLIVHLITGHPQHGVRFGLNRTPETIEEQARLVDFRLYLRGRVTDVVRVPQQTPVDTRYDLSDHTEIYLPTGSDWETLIVKDYFS